MQNLFAQLPDAAYSALLLGEMSQHVVLEISSELAAQLALGSAEFMRAIDGGFRANIVDVVTRFTIGQAAWAPISAATLGVAAAWKTLSFAVGQKHLHDISTRLTRIEHDLQSLREQIDADLVAEIRGDAAHLRTVARTLAASSAASATMQRATIDSVVREAHARHRKLLDRLEGVARKFTPTWAVRFLGQRQTTRANELERHADSFARYVTALRLNALLLTVAAELLRRLGDSSYATSIEEDIDRLTAEADARIPDIVGMLDNSVKSLVRLMPGKASDAEVRGRLAARIWTQAKTAARVRAQLGEARRGHVFAAPTRLLVALDERRVVGAVDWLDEAPVTPEADA